MKNIVIFLFIVLLSACKKQETLLTPLDRTNNLLLSATDSAVHSSFSKYKDDLNTIGLSIGIFKNGTINFYGYGETKAGNNKIPDANTLFEIGSITKTFTSIAILKMLEESNHTIDTPIRLYLPANLPTLSRNGVELTFKHLLTHTSGLSYMPDNFGNKYLTGNIGKAFEEYDRNRLYTYLSNANIRHDPFTVWEYSNSGMGLLGTILELKYKKSYGDVIKENILMPLGLNSTFTRMEQTNSLNWATGYSKGKEAKYWNSLGALDGAGVIKSNVTDLLKYALAILNNQNQQLTKPIEQSQQITFLPFTENEIYKINMRLGWFQYIHKSLPDENFIWHNGGTGGFNSDIYINKKSNTALILLFNSDAGSEGRLNFTEELLRIISN